MLTAFGSKTKVIPVDGYGTFDGTMLDSFRRPRIVGTFKGEDIRAFDVTWGSVTGDATIENSYADVTNVVVSSSGGSTINVDGKFSLGYPRRDGGEQIHAHISINGRPVADLKHAFDIDDYDFSGTMSGAFDVTGDYERPFGSGMMTITDGNAYGETFDRATADVKLEGDGVRLENIQADKGDGQGSGSGFAAITWKGTYSFNFSGSNIEAEKLALMQGSTIPFSGVLDFRADGSGSFDRPKYDVKATIRDFFVADEGIGTVTSEFNVDGDRLTFTKLNAFSPRLQVDGSGTIALNNTRNVNLQFSVTDTSLDPYIRAFEPRLSPYTTARVSGNLHVYGELSDIDTVLVDATVDRFDARLFDFPIRNPDDPKNPGIRKPIRLSLDRHAVRVVDMQLEGQDTSLTVTGNVDLHNETIKMGLAGAANLRILEGFTRNVLSTGSATVKADLSGPMRNPVLTGSMEVNNGRIRHFSLPHALDQIAGVITFDSKGVNLDELTAKIGNGPVTFGGSIGIDGYRPGRVDVTINGENMALRYPDGPTQWLRATVDADLTLDGTVEALTLRGDVNVRRALYTKNFSSGVNVFDFGQSQAAPTSTFVTPTLPLAYNIQINAPSTIQAQNNLLSEVVASADLRLGGTFDRPLLQGNIDIDRGDVFFGGNRYQIRTASSIRFSDSIEPFFDIEATTRKRVPGETYIITVSIIGPDLGNVTFSSDPSLPDFQLFALLFSDITPNKDVELSQYAAITPQQQLLRDQITRVLTNTATGELNRALQDALAVESFQLSPTLLDPNQQSARLDPAAHVTILKRVGNRIYLTYSRSLSSTTRDQVIVIEIDQTEQLSWILSRNEDGTYAVDLRLRGTR